MRAGNPQKYEVLENLVIGGKWQCSESVWGAGAAGWREYKHRRSSPSCPILRRIPPLNWSLSKALGTLCRTAPCPSAGWARLRRPLSGLRQPPGLAVAPPPRRADCRDALILRRGLDMGEAMQRPIRIGTGSPRRIALLSKLYPSVEAVPIRGNIDTRLRKSQEELDGAVLAAAGLLRAGMEEWITAYLDPASFVPAPAQGILGLEYREENQWLCTLLAKLSHEPSDFAARAERAFLKAAGGNCHMPVGAWCRPGRGGFLLTGLYGVPGSSKTVQGEMAGGNPERLGRALAQRLMEEYEADGRE